MAKISSSSLSASWERMSAAGSLAGRRLSLNLPLIILSGFKLLPANRNPLIAIWFSFISLGSF
jgi:hypothetical protein